MTPHKATPEQWETVERFVEECGYDACLLELRDRLAAAEQRINELEAAANHQQQDEDAERAMEPAPAIGPEWQPCVKLPITVHVREQRPGETHVSTREGITPVQPDDLIMRGVQGEEYPIGRELFNQTYRMGEASDPHPPAPAGGLLQTVGAAICSIADCGDTPLNWAPEARAAILAVAGWLEHRKPAAIHCAALLREEVRYNQ